MYLLGVSLLVIIWWIAIWGLVDICVNSFIKTRNGAICLYTGMAAVVLGIMYINPDIYEKMV
jgi:hypothetical protein